MVSDYSSAIGDADAPKSLSDPRVRAARLAALSSPRVAPLTTFAASIRAQAGPMAAVPDFDPWDGGIDAECLFLLEAPGPRAVKSGFVSRNNPDETARNWFELQRDAGLARERTVMWNVVPWYIGSGQRIRPADPTDISAGLPYVQQLLALLPRLRAVALVGRKAQRAELVVRRMSPGLHVFTMPHPSPLFVNTAPANRAMILAALVEIATFLGPSGQ
jgi:uracil-DNA glycosylase